MMKPYCALDVSKFILKHESKCQRGVSNLRLQKLLYFVQAKSLMDNNMPCFGDDIEAWDFGPVVPNVYHHYKIFGSSAIPCNDVSVSSELENDSRMKYSICDALGQCSKYSTSQLVDITHMQSSWKNAYRKFDNRITNDAIRKEFIS